MKRLSLFILIALISIIGWTNPGFADIFTDGLKIYLPFDGDAEDQAGDPNDGSEHDISYETGKFGEAASFNGSGSYILISPGINIGSSSFTVSFWFKTNDTDGYMLDAREGSDQGYYLISYPTPQNGIYFGAKGGTELQVHAYGYQDDEWHMATGVRDTASDSLLLYIDGALKESVSGDPGNLQDPSIYLGRRYTYTSGHNYHYYQGLIDDFRLYDRALDADEVAALYRYNPVPVPASAMLLLSGLAGLAGIKRLRLSKKS